jgi:hypothetical protein
MGRAYPLPRPPYPGRDCCAFAIWSVRAADAELILGVTGDSDEAVGAVQFMFAAAR